MRIVPYAVDKNTVSGIIVSFVDLTESKLHAIAHEGDKSKDNAAVPGENGAARISAKDHHES